MLLYKLLNLIVILTVSVASSTNASCDDGIFRNNSEIYRSCRPVGRSRKLPASHARCVCKDCNVNVYFTCKNITRSTTSRKDTDILVTRNSTLKYLQQQHFYWQKQSTIIDCGDCKKCPAIPSFAECIDVRPGYQGEKRSCKCKSDKSDNVILECQSNSTWTVFSKNLCDRRKLSVHTVLSVFRTVFKPGQKSTSTTTTSPGIQVELEDRFSRSLLPQNISRITMMQSAIPSHLPDNVKMTTVPSITNTPRITIPPNINNTVSTTLSSTASTADKTNPTSTNPTTPTSKKTTNYEPSKATSFPATTPKQNYLSSSIAPVTVRAVSETSSKTVVIAISIPLVLIIILIIFIITIFCIKHRKASRTLNTETNYSNENEGFHGTIFNNFELQNTNQLPTTSGTQLSISSNRSSEFSTSRKSTLKVHKPAMKIPVKANELLTPKLHITQSSSSTSIYDVPKSSVRPVNDNESTLLPSNSHSLSESNLPFCKDDKPESHYDYLNPKKTPRRVTKYLDEIPPEFLHSNDLLYKDDPPKHMYDYLDPKKPLRKVTSDLNSIDKITTESEENVSEKRDDGNGKRRKFKSIIKQFNASHSESSFLNLSIKKKRKPSGGLLKSHPAFQNDVTYANGLLQNINHNYSRDDHIEENQSHQSSSQSDNIIAPRKLSGAVRVLPVMKFQTK